ncbi:MAG TPA: response regulator [Candidatus Polarisedimenticolia bacterium]|jgi:two-component system sensor histidine kinase BarA
MYKVLLADDTRLALAHEKDFLEGRNLKVFVASSAIEARELAMVARPDLIVLDFEMPEMTGAELCQWLKADPLTTDIPVLIFSTHEDEETIRACRQAGAVGFVNKAAGGEALLEEVAKALGVPRRRGIRVPCKLTVGITEGSDVLAGELRDISVSGVFLTATRHFSPGTPLYLRFRLPGIQHEIQVLGEVARVEESAESGPGCGIQFLETDPRSREGLIRFLEASL